jgi:hypothetical protein
LFLFAQRAFRQLARLHHLRFAQGALDRRHQAVEILLQDVVDGTTLERIDGALFAERTRHEDERCLRRCRSGHRERGQTIELR